MRSPDAVQRERSEAVAPLMRCAPDTECSNPH